MSPIPVTLAVLITEPDVASAGTSTCTVIVHVLPAASVGRVHETRFAVFVHEPCEDDTAVTVNAGGTGSVTTTFGAASGPAFDTTIVYENESPGATGSAESVLTMERSSTIGVTVSVSVDESLAGFGSGHGRERDRRRVHERRADVRRRDRDHQLVDDGRTGREQRPTSCT